jgi:D-glycero-alpha-D-manno-heptose 1-phosphate guanylyltransferase
LEGKNINTALILAGGLGTRLRSVVKDKPKPMAEVAGKPFLAYLIDQLQFYKI